VQWDKKRYDEIEGKLKPFMKQSGFKDEQLFFLPISGLAGDNVKERKKTADWFTGQPLLELIDTLEVPAKSAEAPLRIPMLDGFKDMGYTMAIGKVEQGTVRPGMKCVVVPIGKKCTVVSVYINDEEMAYASCGENVTMKMSGVTEDQLSKGFVLSLAAEPCRSVTKFKAQLQVIELPEERPVLTSGYKAVIHCHVAIEECEILKLYDAINMADLRIKGKKPEKNPRFCRENTLVTCSIQLARATAVDAFTGTQQLARFTLRDEGRTIAIGKITDLPKAEDTKGGK
jgi:peptide chain release factor subunit 3